MKLSPALVHIILAMIVLFICMAIYPLVGTGGEGDNFPVMVLLILGLAAYFFLYARLLTIRLDGSARIYGTFLWIFSALVASFLYVPIYGLIVGKQNPEAAIGIGNILVTSLSWLAFVVMNVLLIELVAKRR